MTNSKQHGAPLARLFGSIVLVTVALVTVTNISSSAIGATAPLQSQTFVTASSQGDIGVRLLDVPASAADDPRARQYIVDQLEPGTTISRRVEVSNTTNAALRVSTYAAAAKITDGSFIGEAEKTVNDLSSWTTLSQTGYDIAANSSVITTVTLTIPTDAAPGEQYAVVWAEASTPGENNVKLVNRVGIRMYIAVLGDNPPPSSFTVDTMTAQRDAEGKAVVLAQVHNTGGRAIDLSGTLSLSSVAGTLTAGPYDVKLGTTLAPGQSEPVKVIIPDQIADGPWNATISLKSGLVKANYQAQITFPHETGSSPAVTAREESTPDYWMIIALSVLGTLAILAGVFFIVLYRKRRQEKNKNQKKTPAHRA